MTWLDGEWIKPTRDQFTCGISKMYVKVRWIFHYRNLENYMVSERLKRPVKGQRASLVSQVDGEGL